MAPYHHGNLRETLIKAGIQHICEKGSDSLSLRKISQNSGVSHAAAYTHFKDKEALLNAIRDFVKEQFIEATKKGVESYDNLKDKFTIMGRNYVEFFVENPFYFSFLFQHSKVTVNLDNLEYTENYLPFEIFKTSVIALMKFLNIPEETHLQHIMAMWGVVHGIAGIAVMGSTQYSGDWGELTVRILTNNVLIKDMRNSAIENQ